jgi:hypothetical protein
LSPGYPQDALVRPHFRECSEWNRPLVANVAERRPGEAGYLRGGGRLGNDVVDRAVVFFPLAVGPAEVSGNDAGASIEPTREQELPHHSVHSVNRFVNVLEDEYRPAQID